MGHKLTETGQVGALWPQPRECQCPDPGRVLCVSPPSRALAHGRKEQLLARGGQPVYSPKPGWSKSPRFVYAGRPGAWPLGGPVVLTHTQWGSLAPGLYSFRGTPTQPLLTPPLRTEQR